LVGKIFICNKDFKVFSILQVKKIYLKVGKITDSEQSELWPTRNRKCWKKNMNYAQPILMRRNRPLGVILETEIK